jgi:sugar lactone lactonase YvrE
LRLCLRTGGVAAIINKAPNGKAQLFRSATGKVQFSKRRKTMKNLYTKTILSIIALFVFSTIGLGQSTEFTYQGRVLDNSLPPTANYDFEFSLWDSLANGTQQGTTQMVPGVAVSSGIFTVRLDFLANFPGAARFLQIAMRPAGGGAYTTLAPRQPLTSAPYAVKSKSSETATNALSLGGLAANTYLQTNGDGSALTNLNGANITNNTINASALASDTFPNSRNLSLLGSLRWDLLGQRVAVGLGPIGVAFDGANIWVTNQGSSNVTKLRASDGACAGVVGPPTAACTFPTGTNPNGVAFDGANIWVANQTSHNVTKLRASDGALQGTVFLGGVVPFKVAFDGANIWVTIDVDRVVKVRASDGALQGTYFVGTGPQGVAFDGANIWVANAGSNNVTKLRASDGACAGVVGPPTAACTFAVGTTPQGVAFDGVNMWVANNGSNNVTKLRASDGACAGVVGPPTTACTFAAGSFPAAVAFDGANIWVANTGNNIVTKLRASDGAPLGTFAVGTTPAAVAFDGANIWVANVNSNNVTKLPVFP